MLNLPKDAQIGLKKLSRDIQNLLKRDKEIISEKKDSRDGEKVRSEEIKKENGTMFINNNYYQPQPAVSNQDQKKHGFSRLLKVTLSIVFLLVFIYAIYMLVVNPEFFIDKIESISQNIIRFLRNVFT